MWWPWAQHRCLYLKYSVYSLLLRCTKAMTSAETEGAISLGWLGVQAWQSAMSPRARWYGPEEWLLSPRSRILQCSNSRSCGLHFVVPAGAELTNRESLLAWMVQPNLPTAPTTGQRWWRPEQDDGLLPSSHRMQAPFLVNSLSFAHRYFKFPGIIPPSCYALVNRRQSSGRH